MRRETGGGARDQGAVRDMIEPVTSKLRRTRLFASVPEDGLAELLTAPGLATGSMLDTVKAQPGDLVVLLEGGLHMLAKGAGGDHLAILTVDEGTREPAVLYTIPPGAELKLTRESTYLVIDGDRLDRLLSTAQEARSLASLDDAVRERVAALIKAPPFKRLSFDHIVRCAEAMQSLPAAAGDAVVRQGEPGDYFYVIESGEAEVLRAAPEGHAAGLPAPIARLKGGATFGEEALLQDAPRNATVRMLTDGQLLRLARRDFDRLLTSELVSVLPPAAVDMMLQRGVADVIDCRTEAEWELWRLPRARLIPLDQLRERARGLDKTKDYIVYCRTGRRSSAAVFVMRQLGLKAHVLKGGISAWPFAIEGLPAGS